MRRSSSPKRRPDSDGDERDRAEHARRATSAARTCTSGARAGAAARGAARPRAAREHLVGDLGHELRLAGADHARPRRVGAVGRRRIALLQLAREGHLRRIGMRDATSAIVPSVLDDVHRAPVGDVAGPRARRPRAASRDSRASARARRPRRAMNAALLLDALAVVDVGRRADPEVDRARRRRGSAPRGRGASGTCRRRRGSGTRPRTARRSRASARAARPPSGRSSGCTTREPGVRSPSSSARHARCTRTSGG